MPGKNRILGALVFILLSCCHTICLAGGGPKNVLLVINDNSAVSQSIGAYYQLKRGIPPRNVCHIQCSTAEITTKADYYDNIAVPVRGYIESAGIHDRIDYIVVTKGIPLTATWTQFPYAYTFSVSSMLTCVGEPTILDGLVNPYGPTASPAAPAQTFSHQLDLGGKHFYAVTRLDARTEADMRRMIDDSLIAQRRTGLFLLDGAAVSGPAYEQANDRLRQANHALATTGFSTYYDDTTFDSLITEFVGGQQGVMGYFSWGSNEPSWTHGLYMSNYFAPGSIADSYVSSSGRTFTDAWTSGSQSLIVDLVPQGASAVTGYVAEPTVGCTTYPNTLFQRYTQGYNMAESFLAASPMVHWMSATAGDPLMAPYATPPVVSISGLDSSQVYYGSVLISASASDVSGIAKVEFYIDDVLVSTRTARPYRYTWDTSSAADGTHLIEVIAYENSGVRAQGMAKLSVQTNNTILHVSTVSELASIPDGRTVKLSNKPTIGGTDAFSDCIYVSETDRSAGIRVTGASDVPTDTLATVTGTLATIDGQRTVSASSVTTQTASVLPMPFGVANLNVGNRGVHDDQLHADLQPGLSNECLLVRVWGYVTTLTDDGFRVSDGSMAQPSQGLKISLANMAAAVPQPLVGSYVTVTGVSAFIEDDGRLIPVVRPRSGSDIVADIPLVILVSPAGTIRRGRNLLSIPGVAVSPSADAVLAGLRTNDNLYCWDSNTGSLLVYDPMQPELFPALAPGFGFWLSMQEEATIMVEGLGNDEPQTDMWINLPKGGYSLIGQPFNHLTAVNDCFVSDGARVISIEQAVDAGWVEPTMYYWDNLLMGLGALDIGFGSVSNLEPWRGYWFKSYRDNLALLVPSASG